MRLDGYTQYVRSIVIDSKCTELGDRIANKKRLKESYVFKVGDSVVELYEGLSGCEELQPRIKHNIAGDKYLSVTIVDLEYGNRYKLIEITNLSFVPEDILCKLEFKPEVDIDTGVYKLKSKFRDCYHELGTHLSMKDWSKVEGWSTTYYSQLDELSKRVPQDTLALCRVTFGEKPTFVFFSEQGNKTIVEGDNCTKSILELRDKVREHTHFNIDVIYWVTTDSRPRLGSFSSSAMWYHNKNNQLIMFMF